MCYLGWPTPNEMRRRKGRFVNEKKTFRTLGNVTAYHPCQRANGSLRFGGARSFFLIHHRNYSANQGEGERVCVRARTRERERERETQREGGSTCTRREWDKGATTSQPQFKVTKIFAMTFYPPTRQL